MASKRTDADSLLPIKVWDEIQAITEWLDRCEPSYRFVQGKGDILVKEHSPDQLRALRAIFEVYGERIKKELPENLRPVDWVGLCDPTVGTYVQTRDDLFLSKARCIGFEHLHEIAARAIAKYNAAALAGAEQVGESVEAGPEPIFQGTTGEVAKHLQCSVQTVRNRGKDGQPRVTPKGATVTVQYVRDGRYRLIHTEQVPQNRT